MDGGFTAGGAIEWLQKEGCYLGFWFEVDSQMVVLCGTLYADVGSDPEYVPVVCILSSPPELFVGPIGAWKCRPATLHRLHDLCDWQKVRQAVCLAMKRRELENARRIRILDRCPESLIHKRFRVFKDGTARIAADYLERAATKMADLYGQKRAVKVIQKAWLHAYYDPEHRCCKGRLQHEFETLGRV